MQGGVGRVDGTGRGWGYSIGVTNGSEERWGLKILNKDQQLSTCLDTFYSLRPSWRPRKSVKNGQLTNIRSPQSFSDSDQIMSGGRQSAWLSEWGHWSQNAAEISLVCVDWSWSKWQDENQNSVNYHHSWPLGLLFSLNTRKGWRLWWKRKIWKVSGAPLIPRSEIKRYKGLNKCSSLCRWNLIYVGEHLSRVYCRFLWQCCSAFGRSVSFKES